MQHIFLPGRKGLLVLVLLFSILSGCGAPAGEDDSAEGAEDSTISGEPAEEDAASILLEPDDSSAADSPDAQNAANAQQPEDTTPAQEADSALTISETVQFIKAQSPDALGLPGEDMSTYRIYPMEGAVLVDGRVCAKLGVYELVPATKTNHILGIYLLARDQTRLYRMDIDTEEVEELAVPGLAADPAAPPAAEDNQTDATHENE